MDFDFWFTILLGAIGGGIFGPMLVNWLKKRGWIKIDEGKKQNN